MLKKISPLLFLLLVLCYRPERNCEQFSNGAFTFTSTIDGIEQTTAFVRKDAIEIDTYNGKTDTSSVRWINPCEYIVKKLHTVNKAEEKSIHIKILSTTDNSYTFEYNIVGNTKKQRGTATKTN